jgi:hypothetical protein
VRVPRSNAGTSPRVVLSLGGGDEGRALAVGSTAVQYRGLDRGRDPGKLRRGRGGDRASTRGNGCGGGPRTPCGARTRCRCAVARKARTGLPWVSSPGGLGTNAGEGLGLGLSPDSGKASPEGEFGEHRAVNALGIGGCPRGPAVREDGLASRGHTLAAPGLMGGRGPAYWTSHSRPQAGKWGAVPGEAPGTATGETGAKPHGLLREESGRRPKGPAGPQAVESPGLRDALIPKGPPLSPPPTGGGFRRYAGRPWRARRSASRP